MYVWFVSVTFTARSPRCQTGNEQDITMQAGRQKGALPLIRKFNEHSERLLNSALYVLCANCVVFIVLNLRVVETTLLQSGGDWRCADLFLSPDTVDLRCVGRRNSS